MSEYTLLLSDGSTISADIEGEISKWVRELLDSGRKVRVRTDDKDVAGHATSDLLELQLWDDGDTEGHALTLRLPNAEAARDLQKKLLATGALVGVIAVGAGVAQVAPTLNISSPDAGAATVQRSVTWDESHSSLRAAPSVAGTRAADWDQAHAPGAGSSAVVGGAVNPAQPRDNLRTDAHTPLVPPASANPLNRDPEAIVGTTPVVPPASANPLVRDGQADMAPTAPAAAISPQASADSRHHTASSSAPSATAGSVDRNYATHAAAAAAGGQRQGSR